MKKVTKHMDAVRNGRLLWPSSHPKMTQEELEAWLPGAIEAATAKRVQWWKEYRAESIGRIRQAIAELEEQIRELEEGAAGRLAFVEVDCPCCLGSYLVARRGPEDEDSPTIAEHLATTDDPSCDRANWGAASDLRECLRVNDLDGDGQWLIIPDPS